MRDERGKHHDFLDMSTKEAQQILRSDYAEVFHSDVVEVIKDEEILRNIKHANEEEKLGY